MKEDKCIFCRIANGEIPSATVYEDDQFRAILDMGPASKGHTLILPKEHFKDVCELKEAYASKVLSLGGRIGAAMKKAWAVPVLIWFRITGNLPGRPYFISICT